VFREQWKDNACTPLDLNSENNQGIPSVSQKQYCFFWSVRAEGVTTYLLGFLFCWRNLTSHSFHKGLQGFQEIRVHTTNTFLLISNGERSFSPDKTPTKNSILQKTDTWAPSATSPTCLNSKAYGVSRSYWVSSSRQIGMNRQEKRYQTKTSAGERLRAAFQFTTLFFRGNEKGWISIRSKHGVVSVRAKGSQLTLVSSFPTFLFQKCW